MLFLTLQRAFGLDVLRFGSGITLFMSSWDLLSRPRSDSNSQESSSVVDDGKSRSSYQRGDVCGGLDQGQKTFLVLEPVH